MSRSTAIIAVDPRPPHPFLAERPAWIGAFLFFCAFQKTGNLANFLVDPLSPSLARIMVTKMIYSADKGLLIVVAAALVDAQGRVLLAQRPAHKSLGGLWEFPGGKLEPGESPAAALARELEEELAVKVDVEALDPFAFASHAYEGFHLIMPLFLTRRWHGEPQALEGQALAWVLPADMHAYPMPAADLPLVAKLKAL
jgi:8-oxo-dGTP diphosphatase